jgi:hypothetical protein
MLERPDWVTDSVRLYIVCIHAGLIDQARIEHHKGKGWAIRLWDSLTNNQHEKIITYWLLARINGYPPAPL